MAIHLGKRIEANELRTDSLGTVQTKHMKSYGFWYDVDVDDVDDDADNGAPMMTMIMMMIVVMIMLMVVLIM